MSTPVLEIVDLRKSFDQNLVLHDVNLVVPEHTATVLIGASGSGKSTLLRCINLLEPIDDGLILLDGQEISDPAIDVDLIRRKLGIVFQSFNLFPHNYSSGLIFLKKRMNIQIALVGDSNSAPPLFARLLLILAFSYLMRSHQRSTLSWLMKY